MALKDESGGDELDPADIYLSHCQVIECMNYVLMMKSGGAGSLQHFDHGWFQHVRLLRNPR